jgi:CubicO group peptidase (beta-lactamase class C family)
VRGNGDGGAYSTVADIAAFWRALLSGRIIPPRWVAEMVRPRSDVPAISRRYGLGLWLHESSEIVLLDGYDAGVSFQSSHDPGTGTTRTVISNTSEGAWDMAELLANDAG